MITAVFLALAGVASVARAGADIFQPPMPADPEQVDVYLLTVGRGQAVHANYGHTILRVVDHAAGLDMNFNWGIFDFFEDGFAWRFYKGDLRYQLGVMERQSMLHSYRRAERRSMVQERVVLTAAQKMRLMERIIWNARPENVFYSYQQFLDNCSTRVRDYLDEAVGGGVRAFYGERPSEYTLRRMVRESTAPLWWAYFGVDMIANDYYDRPMTQWGEMFLPAYLRKHLRELPAFDDGGKPVPGRKLLEQSELLIDLPEPRPATNPYFIMMAFFGLPALALAGLALTPAAGDRLRAVALGALLTGWGLWAGLLGVIYPVNATLSGYAELRELNAGAWIFWPVDGIYALIGLRMLWRRRLIRWPVADWLTRAHVAGLGGVLVLWAAGVIRQDLSAMLATSGVLAAVVWTAWLRTRAAEAPPA